MLIELPEIPFIAKLAVYKSMDINNRHWIVYQFNDDTEKYELIGNYKFGDIVRKYLNYFAENEKLPAETDGVTYISKEKNIIMKLSKGVFYQIEDDAIPYFGSYIFSILKSNTKSFDIERLFLMIRRFFYFYENKNYHGVDYDFLSELVTTEYELSNDEKFTSLVKMLSICEMNNVQYERYLIEDWEILLAMDITELMANKHLYNDVLKYFHICKCCKRLFNSKDKKGRNIKYCDNCCDKPKEKKSPQFKSNDISSKRKKIVNIFSKRIERALNKESLKKSTGYEETGELMSEKISKQKKEFIDEFKHYEKIVKGTLKEYNMDKEYDENIKTEEDLLEWLIRYEEHMNIQESFIERSKKNVKNDEKG